ncbi:MULTISPECIES: SusC/RagA family TonB-linked outer membrane protein [Olivibacter]|nr:SusC/RagA family TonB-linked outer membrane protein [Olivibacter jilunii]
MHSITGRVHSAVDSSSLSGATIQINAASTKTDRNGNFTINTDKSKGVLNVTFLGFQSKEVSFDISSTAYYTISLSPQENTLDEAVVIGYGETSRRFNTGSVSSITAKEIGSQPVTNVLSALSGRMPGVFVQTTNGLPGGNINIQIRGKGSIAAGTAPLYIIDGVPYDGGTINEGSRLGIENIAGSISPLNNLNPNDIESITILKDADATAIYGSRGTNGVILITTKRGEAGNTKFDVNFVQGYNKIANQPRLLNVQDYLQIRREAFQNDSLIPSSDPTSPNYAPDLTIWDTTRTTDWTDYIIGNVGNFSSIQTSLSGGTDKINFLISANYRKESTILIGNSSFRRGGFNSSLHYRSTDQKFSINLSNNYSQNLTKLPNPVTNLSSNILLPPHYPIYNDDNSYNWYAGTNILAEQNAQSKNSTNNFINNINLNYSLIEGLDLKLSGGYTRTNYDQVQKFPSISLYPGTVNYTNFGINSSESIIVEPQITYQAKLNKTLFTILGGGTYQNRSSKAQFINAGNFSVESLMENLASAGEINARTNNYTQYKYLSFFSRVTFNIEDRYILNGTLRRDGSSRFGPGNKFGNFGSIGAAWLISNEKFLKWALPIVSFAKIRASYGTTGNDQISDYQYLSTYGSSGSTLYQGLPRLVPSRIANANFRWENTRKIELAMELGFFQDRVLINTNYFLNQSRDQLVSYSIPQITGFSSYLANLPAVIQNKGWEIELNAKIIQNRNFNWSGIFNITLPKNQLKSFENFETSSYAMQYELGYDINRFYGYKFLGVDPESGNPLYAGEDGKESATPYFYYTLGKSTPDFYGGFGNTLSFKEFQFDIFFQFTKQVSKGGLQYYPGVFVYNNYRLTTDRWNEIGEKTDVPKATTLWDSYYSASSANIFNASFIRLKNVSFSYSLPSEISNKIKVKGIKILFQGQNLITFWDKNAAILDPESGALTASSKNIPPVKSYALGLQLTF